MKKIILFLLLLTTFTAFSQYVGETFQLNEPLPGTESYIYQASYFVELEPGFEYAAQGSNSFVACIDPMMVFPPYTGQFGGHPITITEV